MLSSDWMQGPSPDARRYPAPPPRRARGIARRMDALARKPGAPTAALILLWAAVVVLIREVPFVRLNTNAQVGLEAVSTFGRFFGALVLLLFPTDRDGLRLRWVGSGFLVLGFGSLLFGFLAPLSIGTPDIERAIWASVVVWALSGTLFVVGLVPAAPPRAVLRGAVLALGALGALGGGIVFAGDRLPVLCRGCGGSQATLGDALFAHDPSLLGWVLAVVPLGLSVAATVAVARRIRETMWGNWLLLVLVLLTGAQLHSLLWPSNFGAQFSTVNLLRLAVSAVVVVGGTMEFRRIATERTVLLATEQERSRKLQGVADTKSDLARIVAHELASPIATIRGFLHILGSDDLAPHERAAALATIGAEADRLSAFAADVRAIATVESGDFAVYPFAVDVSMLLADVSAFARALPDDRPFVCSLGLKEQVCADPERIGQVLRNLVGNAAKYSPPGSPIEVRADRHGDRIRIAVVDQGFGIHPDDLDRVFAKFERGRAEEGRRITGTGVGLFVSRRIVRAHGAELTVDSTLGAGSVFAFELEVAPCRRSR